MRLLLSAAAALLLSGCGQLGYLSQSVGGHMKLMAAARPVDTWLAEPDLKPGMRERLLLTQRIRDFAVQDLKLPDNNSYRRYADLKRGAAVWNVMATPELSLTLKAWCFPIMGCVGYRGYFSQADAQEMADQLRGEGLEANVYPVPAYSTLGWSALLGGDPLLNTFIGYPEGELAGMVFHELAHQVAYAADDTQFNESFATAVERLGARAWLQAHADAEALAQYEASQQRRARFQAFVMGYRERLVAVYSSQQPDAAKREAKAALMKQMREAYEQLKAGPWHCDKAYDAWFARANNPSFALLSAYTALSPAFEALFEAQGGDWQRFYAEVKRMAEMPKALRNERLKETLDGRHPHSP